MLTNLGMPKTKSQINHERIQLHKRNQFNPIRGLTPERLSRELEAFEAGYLSGAAMIWDRIARRDDRLRCVIPKRLGAPVQRGWEIVTDEEDNARATRQKKALEYFFNNVAVTDATQLNYRRGFSGLLRQMMSAVSMRYAAHEIVWKPSRAGLTAEFRFVPLWFFENRTGVLRFLENPYSMSDGIDLDDGGWMVTVGEGLMEASSVSYMLKSGPLQDWYIWCEKFAVPYLMGKTNAKPGSPEWEAMKEALQEFIGDGAGVSSIDGEIVPIEVGGGTVNPMMQLIERLDRALTAMWRGGDLSSMSGDENLGASLQQEEADILLYEDIEMLEDTLNATVVPWVLRYAIGDSQSLARLRIPVPDRQDNTKEMGIDRFFKELGIPQAVKEIRERYGRGEPDDGDDVVPMPGSDDERTKEGDDSREKAQEAQKSQETEDGAEKDQEDLANERLVALPNGSPLPHADQDGLVANSLAEALDVLPATLEPLTDLIRDLVAAGRNQSLSGDELRELAAAALNRLPELLGDLDVEALATVMRGAVGTAFLQGIESATGAAEEAPAEAA